MNNYYVYLHKDPTTKEIVYVGKGRHGRAWDVTRCRTENKDHQNWMLEQSEKGFLPSDWVTILEKNLTEKEAFSAETVWMHEHGSPEFNRTSGQKNHQAKITDDQAREIFKLASIKQHKEIAEEYGISRSAVSMIATRKQWRAATACLIK